MERSETRRWIAAGLVLAALASSARADDWPQWLGPQRDGIWREQGIVEKFPANGLKVRWKAAIGAGYAGPAVAGGKVFVHDRVLNQGEKNPADPFAKEAVRGVERVLCFDEKTGNLLWKHEYECAYTISYSAGPRCTPTVSGDRVYTLGAMGDLRCLDVKDGKPVWSKKLLDEYQMPVPYWGFTGHPLIDGDRLICLVGGKGSVAVAFHKDTGKELWKALSAKEPGYCPPMLFEMGGKKHLVIWHPESVNGLDPETGAVHWTHRYPGKMQVRAGMTIPTPRYLDGKLFCTCFYDGGFLLEIGQDGKSVKELWRKRGRSEKPEDTEGLHGVMVTPHLKHNHIYGVCSYGELRCLNAATGERAWSDLKATGGKELRWGNAFMVAHDSRFFLFNEHGELILAHLSPKAYQEISRAKVLPPTNGMAGIRGMQGRLVLWSHPAFANRSMYARNDTTLVCVSLAADDYK